MSHLDDLRTDLDEEQRVLDRLVAPLEAAQWHVATPSPGWDVADQIGHLAYFDNAARTAILTPERFRESVTELFQGAVAAGLDAFTLGWYRSLAPDELLGAWRRIRDGLAEAAAVLDEGARVEWYGPSMGAASFLSARLMETWAHGTDVADALGVALPATRRLRHITRLGFMTRAWSYAVRNETPPAGSVRLELTGPDGDPWVWGPEGANDTVSGPAEDFCLVVTQRRHVEDTSLRSGPLARHWLDRAQAFAGGPSEGPRPRSTDEPH